jgi:hypothetical protein
MAAFLRADFELVRAIPLAARFLPALWMLNGMARVYLDLAASVPGSAMVPDSYLESYLAVFAALEAGQTERACAVLDAYLDEHDRLLLGRLDGASS